MKAKILVIDCGSKKVPDIEHMLHDLGMETHTLLLSSLEKITETYTAIVVSGAPVLLTETHPEPYLQKFKILLDTNLPLLGICFGHQLLGMSFGAEVSRCKEDRDIQTIRLMGQDKLFDSFGIWENFMEDHCECITLPNGFTQLGSSVICENEIMRHTEKLLYGVQFHPEVSGENGKKIFANFIKICKS